MPSPQLVRPWRTATRRRPLLSAACARWMPLGAAGGSAPRAKASGVSRSAAADRRSIGRRAWAATIAAGPDATAKAAPQGEPAAPREREALLAWLAASTQRLLDALWEAGPDRGCWAWWSKS
ncbi:maleylpyruvate isomerase N-terminal domain-containing protein [Streptomyces sp. NPDC047085]|uniref:maleylpyruvate isomerase N-terminal domain-containing protein n=1 Tax=Streptomyces sp. NPDC047085 TaxID=3155140 RepID=UPI0033C60386